MASSSLRALALVLGFATLSVFVVTYASTRLSAALQLKSDAIQIVYILRQIVRKATELYAMASNHLQ